MFEVFQTKPIWNLYKNELLYKIFNSIGLSAFPTLFQTDFYPPNINILLHKINYIIINCNYYQFYHRFDYYSKFIGSSSLIINIYPFLFAMSVFFIVKIFIYWHFIKSKKKKDKINSKDKLQMPPINHSFFFLLLKQIQISMCKIEKINMYKTDFWIAYYYYYY